MRVLVVLFSRGRCDVSFSDVNLHGRREYIVEGVWICLYFLNYLIFILFELTFDLASYP